MRSGTPKPTANPDEPVVQRIGENLYRHASGKYYAPAKRGGKQFRRSLKTADRKLADCRLAKLRGKVGNLFLSEDTTVSFGELAKHWLDTTRHSLNASNVKRRESCIKNPPPNFKGVTIRNATARHCER
jgi:hypothetical protein